MFRNCTSLNTLNIANFDTIKCSNLYNVFDFCYNLTLLVNKNNKNCENLINSKPEYIQVSYIE